MTTASKITIVRILLIPAFMAVALLGFVEVALALFVLASLTDMLDGYIARTYNQISDFGKFMDPLADKLLTTAALLLFVQWGQMPAWVLMVILAREFAVSGLRMMAAATGTVIAAGVSGKIKTVVTFIAICLMLTSIHDMVLFATITIDIIAIVAMLLTTVYSGAEYLIKNYKVFLGESKHD
ncbi:MAG: CDP-diacylglycerol--glycerol-3-phosphate 3-phosphatidyltransferase [Oscillospiraceae bacterium]|nr:CDP-diacylglycerol--glycerol-3-phosphate 3-phosphatidyltransferase [Oscillospiraceae bacterium]